MPAKSPTLTTIKYTIQLLEFRLQTLTVYLEDLIPLGPLYDATTAEIRLCIETLETIAPMTYRG